MVRICPFVAVSAISPHRPRRTLFPYTTLFRSSVRRRRRHELADLSEEPGVPNAPHLFSVVIRDVKNGIRGVVTAGHVEERSEEHTSELQSRRDLVCRLMLEKKKPQNTCDTILP